MDGLFPLEPDKPATLASEQCAELDAVEQFIRREDPLGAKFADIFRQTFDQLYDGQRTGRYRWDQLYKTERTHYGTLAEINIQRAFGFDDGQKLDYNIAGFEVDCKFSFSSGWMIPPECFDHIMLLTVANDEKSSWSVGLIVADAGNRNAGVNRDGKSSLSSVGKARIRWLFRNASMAPNALLQLPRETVDFVFSERSGQKRINELLRTARNRRLSRTVIETVATQQDPMKRLRRNGGARTHLAKEGILVLGGDYTSQRNVAQQLGCSVPLPGEVVSVAVAQTAQNEVGVEIDGRSWKLVEAAGLGHAPEVIGQTRANHNR
ncbi:NaeI family type II restriction endonuclease [Arthrobacter rhombi]|uniref:NaeI family type II restriction endonuclease n=1 Tax=Arthrobacter rhombi TaxID=71253 RepID=UPI003FD04CC5